MTAPKPARLRHHDMQRRKLLLAAASSALALGSAGCGGGAPTPAPPPPPTSTRSWKMGFFPTPPKYDTATLLHGVDLWSTRAELAVIHEELPWTELLAGTSADTILERDKLPLVQVYRSKGLQLYFMADLTDGLSRAEEAPQLRALGRSIGEPAVQQVYRDYVAAVIRKLAPDYIGLAAETNLIRALAPASVYAAVVQAANGAAAALRPLTSVPMFVSVQVETAWGVFTHTPYAGVDTDLHDFPFTQILGLSSYPFFSYAQPEDLPADYYSRLLTGHGLKAMVVEGGWSSASAGSISSSPEMQARYITRQSQLLDSIDALGVVQLMFADLDLSTYPQPQPASLVQFAHLGLTDSSFAAKPALAAWDALFARKLA